MAKWQKSFKISACCQWIEPPADTGFHNPIHIQQKIPMQIIATTEISSLQLAWGYMEALRISSTERHWG